ncbi:MAG: hypothetical protein ACK4YP_25870, partial [Myxococcota bacterium]
MALAVLAVTSEAHAGLIVGGGLEGGATLTAPMTVGHGHGFVGSAGYRLGLGPVFLQPEAQGSYMTFPGTRDSVHAARLLAGGRVGFSMLVVQPALFAHTGIGWMGPGRHGRAFDMGLAVGFKVIP